MLVAVMGGQTLLTIADGPPTVPLVKGGKVRALAVTGSERSAELPDVPSMTEVGFAEVNTGLWSGLFVPAGTPAPIVKKLEETLRRVIADPDVNSKLKAMAVNAGRRSVGGIPRHDRRRHQDRRRRGEGGEPGVQGLKPRIAYATLDCGARVPGNVIICRLFGILQVV